MRAGYIGRWLAAGFLLAVLLAAIGFRNAVADPVVVRYRVPVAGLAGPLRIVQLTDLHLGPPDMDLTRVRRIVAQVAALRPDMVVLTGDYLGGKATGPRNVSLFAVNRYNLDDAIAPLATLRPRLGIFAVRGNHDDRYWAHQVIPRHDIHHLDNRWADAGPLIVAGMDDYITGNPDAVAALRGAPAGRPVLMLMHNPDAWPRVPASVALTLAGHTHGGQVVLPLVGALRTGSIYRQRFRYGLIAEAGRRLIVSCGLGTTALPIRFGAPPEIVEVTLVPA